LHFGGEAAILCNVGQVYVFAVRSLRVALHIRERRISRRRRWTKKKLGRSYGRAAVKNTRLQSHPQIKRDRSTR
jgi:hypothetical protein